MLAVNWLSERIAKERKIVEDALARNQERRTGSKRNNKGITVGKAVVQLTKQENNCFRLQYNSELIFDWDKKMTDLILTCNVPTPPTR